MEKFAGLVAHLQSVNLCEMSECMCMFVCLYSTWETNGIDSRPLKLRISTDTAMAITAKAGIRIGFERIKFPSV